MTNETAEVTRKPRRDPSIMNHTTRDIIMDDIWVEIARAETQHPRGFPTDPVRQCAIVTEECGEAIRAALDMTRETVGSHAYVEHRRRMYTELVETAAAAIQALAVIRTTAGGAV